MTTLARSSMILLMALAACSVDDSDLRIVSELPEGVVNHDAVIQLTFNRGIVSDTRVNMWTDEPYIEFTPAIPGKFVWQDSTRLVFSPDAPLAGDTKFSAKLNTALLLQESGARAFSGDSEFEFSTQAFTLAGAEFFYDRIDNKRTVGVRANLEFTYPVKPEEVAKYLKLSIDGNVWKDFKVTAPGEQKTIPVEIGSLKQLELERTIQVEFEEALTSPATNTRITMEKPLVYKLPRLDELKIYGHQFGFDGTQSWIKITSSQEIDLTTVKSFITVDPSRSFTVESDGKGIVLKGRFEPGTAFKLVLKKGLESFLGAKLQNEYVTDIVIGNIAPSFGFASASGVYMLLGGQKTLELKTVNMTELNIRVSQVFQNNLVHFLHQGRSYDYDYEYDEETGEERYSRKYRYHVGNFGRMLEFKKIAIENTQNTEVTTRLDLSPYLNTGYKGFYLVEIANPKEAWRSTSKLVSISDLGIIVKRSDRELMAFVVSLETSEPVGGATVSLLSTNNQVMGTQKTDGDGVVKFADFKDLSKNFSLKTVTAERESDFNFIHLDDYLVETSRFETGGKHDREGTYDAFLYGDRNIYRPGEKIYSSGIVRDLNNALPAGLPVKVRILNPQGSLVSEQLRTLNEQGSFEVQYQTLQTALTGEYSIGLYTGDNVYLASTNVSVEDFVPDRLKVQLKASAETARPGETVKFDFQAFNFFGPPAAGRNFEFEGTFEHLPYRSKRFPDFRFHDAGAQNFNANPEVTDGETNEEGKGSAEFEIPRNVTSTGIIRARGRVGVFDESGRPVYQVAHVIVHPKNYFIGLKQQGDYYVPPNSPRTVELIAVNPKDEPLKNFKAKVDVIRFEWHSVLRQHPQTNTLRYVSEKREIVEKTEEVTLQDTPLQYKYSVPRSGEYVVRVSKAGDSGYNQFSFYSYSWSTSDVTSFRISPEAKVEIIADKAVYAPGEKATLLFQTPFSGKMLITVERNKVFTYRVLNVENNAASMDIDIGREFLPNVYVSAVLFRKIKDLNIPLLAGHGYLPIMVEQPSNKIDVSIQAPEKIRPKRKQTITINAGTESGVFVTLAAVDEGICQVKNYQTPDPYKYFYAKKALQTSTYDFFSDLIPEPVSKSIGAAGGGDAELMAMAKRVNPLGVQRFKPLALWSGILKTNSDGIAEVTLDVPEFSGEVRLMALAYKGDRFGSAEKPMKIADPVVLTPALPRFLSPNDQITMPLTVFNTTEKSVNLDFEIETEGGITPAQSTVSLEVGPNQEKVVNVRLSVGSEIGKGVVVVRTTALGEKLESRTEIPIRPISPFVLDTESGIAEAGKTVTQAVPDAYLSFHRRAHIMLSPFPVANFAKQLKHLVGYPHGCLEQTVSKAFPQIYLRDIAVMLDPTILSTGSPSYFVNEAIMKVTSMQMADGGFAYWPGGSYANPWATVYATHFLLEAKKAGYAVQENVVNSALNVVGTIARSKAVVDYYYFSANRTQIKRIADKNTIYALFVLAQGGRADVSLMNYYRRETRLLTNDTQYLLAGAFALSGDRKAFLELLPPEFVTEEAQRTSGGNFDSPIRANALVLNILLETDPANPNIARYMDYLSNRYKSLYWYSTQDNAFTLLAFGKAARMASAAKIEGIVNVGGKEFVYKGGNQKFDVVPFGKTVTFSMKGEGRVFYSIVTEGIRKDGSVRIEDKNLQIRREFFDRSGNGVNLESVKQNDLIVVRLTLRSSVDRLENVAISDLLPAGFEIENPRITETSNYSFTTNAASPQYTDVRDDRINLYTSIYSTRTQVFYYVVRAVTAGEFQYAPVVAEAMYDGEYYSASGQGKVKVSR
ncbi:MAG: alpha-2-macroglobulin [Bacteroidota bacterium]